MKSAIADCSCFRTTAGHAYMNRCAQALGEWMDEVIEQYPICPEARPYVICNFILTLAFQPELDRAASLRGEVPKVENFRKCWEDVVKTMPEILEQRMAIFEARERSKS